MLVLTRRPQEQIRIGDDITITILRVKGNTVRVGVEAPRDVRVVRGELPEFDAETNDAPVAERPGECGEDAGEEPNEAPRPRRPRARPVKPSVALSASW